MNDADEQVKVPSKKRYQEPSLRTYGDIRALTLTSGAMATKDGGAVVGMMMTA
jgi:hypothetical protein